MDVLTLLTLLILGLAVIFIYKRIRSALDSVKGVPLPGPRPLPLLGNTFDVDTRKIYISFANMVKWYGPIFQVNILGQTSVVLNDGKLIRKAFSSESYGEVLNDRPDNAYAKYLVYDSSDLVFGKPGKKTKTMRKMFLNALRFFGDGNEQFEHLTDAILKDFLKEIRETNENDFDLNQRIQKSFGNTTSSLMTGQPAKEDDYKLIWQLNDNVKLFAEPAISLIYELVPFIRFLPGKFGNIFRAAKEARDRLLERFYYDVKNRFDQTQTGEGDAVGFVAGLLKLQREENIRENRDFITETNIKALVVDSIFAATETTSSALINGLALLLEHKDVASTLQAEIDTVIGRGRLPTTSDKNNMPYTMATLFEIIRYTSHAPLLVPHRAMENCTLEGYFIPKHAIVFANVWFVHHDSKLWNDPWVFRPERFLDSDGQLLPPGHIYMQNVLTFSIGQRSCLGEALGKSRMFLYMTSLLQSFDLEPPTSGMMPETDPRLYKIGSVIQVKDFLCRAIPRT